MHSEVRVARKAQTFRRRLQYLMKTLNMGIRDVRANVYEHLWFLSLPGMAMGLFLPMRGFLFNCCGAGDRYDQNMLDCLLKIIQGPISIGLLCLLFGGG